MKKINILFIIGVAVLLTISVLVLRPSLNINTGVNINQSNATATPEPPQKVDDHLTVYHTLEDVNFCGNVYKVKQVTIDGVDLVQRIAELATKNLIPEQARPFVIKKGELAKQICENTRPDASAMIRVTWKQKFMSEEQTLQNKEVYPISISEQLFYIVLTSGDIYITDGFSGTPIGPLGRLK